MKEKTKKQEVIKLPKYKTSDNADLYPKDYEKVDPISITVPNETYSLRDIVERFSREYPKHLLRTGYYDEGNDEDFDDVDITRSPDFDLVDAQELRESIKTKYIRPKTALVEKEDQKPDSQVNKPDEV